MKIAIVIDSASGLSKKQAEASGLYFLPLYLSIDGIEYRDGIDIDSKELIKLLKPDSKVSTSATPIGEAIELIEELNKKYDKIIVYPISEGLSSQYTNLKSALNEFSKVHVVKSNKVSVLTILDILKFQENIKQGMTFEKAIAEIEKDFPGDFLLVPKFNDALVRGGRLTPAAASIAKLLKIVPVIKLKAGKLEKEGMGRVFKKTILKFFKESAERYPNSSICIIHSNNSEIDEIKKDFEKIAKRSIPVLNIPNVIAIHTGIEAIAFGVALEQNLLDKAYQILVEQN